MRRRTLVGGAVLGILLFAGLTLAGSLSALSTPAPVPEAELTKPIEPDTLSASQPQLEQAVLRPADLPGGSDAYSYTAPASPKTTVRRLPELERCSLILDPDGLMRDTNAARAATGRASATLDGPSRVSQLLTTFARSDGASATLQEIQRVTRNCQDFEAVLDDGTPVRVHVEARPIDENTYALQFKVTGGGRVTNGILTLRRVGNVLSVLGELGGDSIGDPLKLVDVTLNRLMQGGRG
jgi:hypothetical protein